jgi:hypothetical protein
MKLWIALTGAHPASRVPFSGKALIYAVLCTVFGTACLHCGIWIMGANGAFIGEVYPRPYESPAMGLALVAACVLLCVAAVLWLCTVANAPRKWLNVLIAFVVVLLCFGPCWILMNHIHLYGEKLGQLILYGREHTYHHT